MKELPKGIRQRGNSLLVDASHKSQRLTATINIDGDLATAIELAKIKKAELTIQLKTGAAPAAPITSRAVAHVPAASSAAPAGEVWTIKEAYDDTVSKRWTKDSCKNQVRNGGFAVAFFGEGTLLTGIDTLRIDEWVEDLMELGNSDATINRKLSALSAMFDEAMKKHRCPARPHFPFRKEFEGRIRRLDEAEEDTILRLMNQWGYEDHADLVILGIDTGMRMGEMLRIEGRDFNLRTSMVTVWINKTYKPRSIPLTTRSKAVIQRRMKAYDGKLFPFNHSWFRQIWDRVRAKMEMTDDPNFVPHVMRHTFGSRLADLDVDLRKIAELMGHSSLTMTQRYTHLSDHGKKDAIAKMESARQGTARDVNKAA
jgi:integrase